MEPAESLPPGVASNEHASQPPVRIEPMTGGMTTEGSPPALLLTPASIHMLVHAGRLRMDGHYQFAVVFAHAACELHTESVLNRLLAQRSDRDLVELVAPHESEIKCLDVPRIRRLYKVLTGDDPTTATWWELWNVSRQDRHSVAHRGALMGDGQALRAIDIADKYIRHLTEKADAVLTPPP